MLFNKSVLIFLLSFVTSVVAAEVLPDVPTQGHPNAVVGIHVVRLRDGKTLLEEEADRLLSPASLNKLITAAAALKLLTPPYRFTTSFYYTGMRKGSVVHGDLIIVGGGDPLFTSEKLWQLAVDLRHLGIRRFIGDIIVDNHAWGDAYYDESRLEAEESSYYSYDAPISAFAVNFNTVSLAIVTEPHSAKPTVELTPYPLSSLKIANHLKWSAKRQNSLEVFRATPDGHSYLITKGQLPKDNYLRKVYRSVGDPVQASGELVKAFLNQEGILVEGAVKSGICPEQSRLLLKVESDALSEIVVKMNQYSNNFIADMLVSYLGVARGEKTGEKPNALEQGNTVLTSFLQKEIGIEESFVLKNGSGLNVDNRMTARQFTELLKVVANDMTVYPEFLVSLPALGMTGTLQRRLRNPKLLPLKGVVRAKTGTLTEPILVSNLAGYIQHPDHGLLAFAILQNGASERAKLSVGHLRSLQDRILSAMFLGKKRPSPISAAEMQH